ncbi:MAG: hypothetical protein Q4D81_06080 [Eubacteriales bacterium]|nr:hypothetical protein [Eubacteriales bacterium]
MKNLQKNRIFVWILVAVLMITTCQASVLADENSAESAAKQQAVLMEGETGPSETVNHEAPAGGADENTAAETGSSQSETAETGDAGENPEDDEETDQEEAETPEEEEETETGKDGGDQKSPSEEGTGTGKDAGEQ